MYPHTLLGITVSVIVINLFEKAFQKFAYHITEKQRLLMEITPYGKSRSNLGEYFHLPFLRKNKVLGLSQNYRPLRINNRASFVSLLMRPLRQKWSQRLKFRIILLKKNIVYYLLIRGDSQSLEHHKHREVNFNMRNGYFECSPNGSPLRSS